MKLPRRVKIGPYVYTVTTSPEQVAWAQKREGKMKLDGYISFRHGRIVINTKDCNGMNPRYTLAHEIVHGLLDVTGYGKQWMMEHGDDEAYEEAFVDRFATAWLNVMRDNPSLVRYLEEK